VDQEKAFRLLSLIVNQSFDSSIVQRLFRLPKARPTAEM
jgi:hypothetical protein